MDTKGGESHQQVGSDARDCEEESLAIRSEIEDVLQSWMGVAIRGWGMEVVIMVAVEARMSTGMEVDGRIPGHDAVEKISLWQVDRSSS